MRYWCRDIIINFEWSQVVQGFWQRYPNPASAHVLTEDVLERRIEGHKLITKRIIMKKGKVPSYLERFTGGVRNIHVIEESVLDLNEKTFVTYTRNIDMQNVMSAHEKCSYRVNPKDPSNVLCERQLWSGSNIAGFGNIISMYGVKQYQKNFESTSNGFNYVLQSMFDPDSLKTSRSEKCTNKKINYILKILKQIHSKVRELLFPHNYTLLVYNHQIPEHPSHILHANASFCM
ncbi:PRELI domain-containing protein 1, mitochondrial-like [Mercenaria mercenaria]|uniref:PRELI domain-containing protein 1, mitochondrial-like n=1 Tax=Mercenaria mercenaria TaxID=6596 RepID=UPI00234F4198|nr:PRELI domain-containing protein 1, mitochondrial-like [Mercenaria mercenaria]